jgi:hypothetical protein
LAIYKNFEYGDGTLYGSSVKVGFSAAPLVPLATGTVEVLRDVVIGKDSEGAFVYSQKAFSVPRVEVSWVKPAGDIFGFRLLRNQDGFSEHEEDGLVIVETFEPPVPELSSVVDGIDGSPLVQGRYAFYTIWLKTADGSWVLGASSAIIIPKEHAVLSPDGSVLKNSTRKFVELFPKVFSTAAQSYLDEVDENSDFYKFFGGLAYTHDEILTYIDLLVPDASGRNINPNMVDLQVQQYGLPEKAAFSIQRKKALIRNGIQITQGKGTLQGIDSLITSLTGFATTVSSSPNLILTPQDSTFYKGVGRWVASTNGTLTSNLTTGSGDLPPQSELYSIDKLYTGKLVTSANNVTMTLGGASPILDGIPVLPEFDYTFSYYVKGTAVNVTPSIKWYDRKGAIIGSEVVGTAVAATSTFAQNTQTAESPVDAVTAVLTLKFASAGTFYVDLVQFAEGELDTYHEARGVEIQVQPTKINFITNPSLGSATGWTIDGEDSFNFDDDGTVPGISRDDSKMLTVTTDDGVDFSLSTFTPEVNTADGYYTFSIYAKTTVADTTENLTFKLEVWEDNGIDEEGTEMFYPVPVLTEFGDPIADEFTPIGGVSDSWERYSVSLYVPSASGSVFLRGAVEGEGSGVELNFDAAQIEQGSKASDYFDGTYEIAGGSWNGTASESVSLLFRNKFDKISRLGGVLKDYLPLNMAWMITSGYLADTTVEAFGFSS